MKNDAPMFGEHVKLVKTGEILKWKSYDPKSQMVEVELPNPEKNQICRQRL
jgi:hypothetical protein